MRIIWHHFVFLSWNHPRWILTEPRFSFVPAHLRLSQSIFLKRNAQYLSSLSDKRITQTEFDLGLFCSVRFGSVLFGSVRFNSIRFGSGSVRVRFGSVSSHSFFKTCFSLFRMLYRNITQKNGAAVARMHVRAIFVIKTIISSLSMKRVYFHINST